MIVANCQARLPAPGFFSSVYLRVHMIHGRHHMMMMVTVVVVMLVHHVMVHHSVLHPVMVVMRFHAFGCAPVFCKS